jgi:hypothetical protein
MTKAEVLALTIKRCDAILEEQLAAAEIVLIDCGATGAELDAAIGRDGYFRAMLRADRDAQVAAVTRFLTVGDALLH